MVAMDTFSNSINSMPSVDTLKPNQTKRKKISPRRITPIAKVIEERVKTGTEQNRHWSRQRNRVRDRLRPG